jgi:ssDNA-binding Zn-finger/Zn-ribbon topoisomerase 1
MRDDIKCPRCRSRTTLKTVIKGPNAGRKFYVCINYPKCKGRVPVSLSKKPTPPHRTNKLKFIRPILLVIVLIILIGGSVAIILEAGIFDKQSSSSTSIPTSTPTPQWTGADGETEHEYVQCIDSTNTDCHSVGSDGQYIELINNPDAKNPTWEELKSFLSQDNTEKHLYIESSFTCAEFAEILHNNAEKAGIRAAFVTVDFGPEYLCGVPPIEDFLAGCRGYCGGLHACNAFQTTDRGLIYIDDTGLEDGDGEDCTVSLVAGTTYRPESIFSDSEWCIVGRTSGFSITW